VPSSYGGESVEKAKPREIKLEIVPEKKLKA